jgi:hypothetical protein
MRGNKSAPEKAGEPLVNRNTSGGTVSRVRHFSRGRQRQAAVFEPVSLKPDCHQSNIASINGIRQSINRL